MDIVITKFIKIIIFLYFMMTALLCDEGAYFDLFTNEVDGKVVEIWPNGEKKTVHKFKKLNPDGPIVLKSISNYKNNKLDGEYIEYNYNGKKIEKIIN